MMKNIHAMLVILKNTTFLTIIFLVSIQAFSQEETPPLETPKATELVIPAAPAFQMLDATSSLVSAPGSIRDFKVDWSFKTYRLSPNLSIEAQPVWSLFYNRPYVDKYQRAGKFMQMLSTLSISVGSLDFNDSIRLFSYAGKLTVYRGYDPLTSKDGFQDLSEQFSIQKAFLDTEYVMLRRELAIAMTREQKDSLEQLVFAKLDEIDELKATQKQRLLDRQEELKAKYWNATTVDVAAGRSFTFNRNFSDRIDSLKFSHRSYVTWMNFGFGLGRKFLITTHIRNEILNVAIPDSGKFVVTTLELDPNGIDTLFFETHDSLFVKFNKITKTILSVGLNIRYGSPRYNFFIEGFYTKDREPSFDDEKWADNAGYGSTGKSKSAVIKEQYIVAFGGEWKVSSNVSLDYGIRCIVNNKIVFKEILPIVSITCLMR